MEIPDLPPRPPWWEGRSRNAGAPQWVAYPTAPGWMLWTWVVFSILAIAFNTVLLVVDGESAGIRVIFFIVFGLQLIMAVASLAWRNRRKPGTP